MRTDPLYRLLRRSFDLSVLLLAISLPCQAVPSLTCASGSWPPQQTDGGAASQDTAKAEPALRALLPKSKMDWWYPDATLVSFMSGVVTLDSGDVIGTVAILSSTDEYSVVSAYYVKLAALEPDKIKLERRKDSVMLTFATDELEVSSDSDGTTLVFRFERPAK